jgi:rubredoxin
VTTYQPRTPHSDSIKRLDCPDCGMRMNVFGIELEKPGHELHTFVCPRCKGVETNVAKIP